MNAPRINLDLSNLSKPRLVVTCACGKESKYELSTISAGTIVTCECGQAVKFGGDELIAIDKQIKQFASIFKN